MKQISVLLALIFALTAAVAAQRIEDGSRRTIGYIESSGRVENGSRSTIGYINSNGRIENGSRSTIGYAQGVKMEHVALFFFFFFKPEKQ